MIPTFTQHVIDFYKDRCGKDIEKLEDIRKDGVHEYERTIFTLERHYVLTYGLSAKIYDVDDTHPALPEPRFTSIDHLDKKMTQLKTYLAIALNDNMLDVPHLRGDVLDFGVGTGGTTLYLMDIARSVTGVELTYPSSQYKRSYKDLFNGRLQEGTDGFEVMMQNPKSYDLIIAYGLGSYSTSIEFLETFVATTDVARKNDSKVLVVSDLATMDKLREILGNVYVPEHYNLHVW